MFKENKVTYAEWYMKREPNEVTHGTAIGALILVNWFRRHDHLIIRRHVHLIIRHSSKKLRLS